MKVPPSGGFRLFLELRRIPLHLALRLGCRHRESPTGGHVGGRSVPPKRRHHPHKPSGGRPEPGVGIWAAGGDFRAFKAHGPTELAEDDGDDQEDEQEPDDDTR